ncbi:acetate/propionate family kinase [Halomonas binhaiensis]|uniref:Acetate kinase n=1 Tax=Halomonas binhaiensis TaxID=2562282 RepID=A0A5C1NGS2_9GAMM|nr:acetate kinase [Halomonas binhaiensis]QEM82456.1 acetate kinase [Halomonas binhaiensis]
MNAPILVINCGSSSLKYALIPAVSGQPRLSGIAERLGSDRAILRLRNLQGEKTTIELPGASHGDALKVILDNLGSCRPIAIGHRVVHGGERFTQATLIDQDVVQDIRETTTLAPLHNPANLEGIAATQELFPGLPQVAVFDTAFHQTLPAYAYRYAIPAELYERHGIRRYGFHGSSHAYVAERLSILSAQGRGGWIIAHLGNGASATAIWQGQSIDTSMGMTPLEGLVMGTRSGDIDPGILLHLMHQCGWSSHDIDQLLNHRSGLLGLSGLTNDMRELEQSAAEGHAGAKLAIDVFCYRLAKSIAGLSCALPMLHGLAFTGGIGENSPLIRARTLTYLTHLGVHLSPNSNGELSHGMEGRIDVGRGLELWVIPTDEEGYIAVQTRHLLDNMSDTPASCHPQEVPA